MSLWFNVFKHRISVLAALVTFLASIYMLTYSGRIESGDSLALFDAASSLVQFGDLLLDESAWFEPPRAWTTPDDGYPLQTLDAPPLQAFLAAPLYWLASRLPGLGLVHTVWLFNVVVCAALGGVFFVYAQVLGYRQTTALLGALALGLATILWPYSKSFFREPLFTLCILAAALALERWRAGRYRSLSWLVAAVLAMLFAWLTKESLIFAAPALIVIALPPVPDQTRWRRLEIALLGLIALFVISTMTVNWYRIIWNIGTVPAIIISRYLPYLSTAMHGYLFSIGGSFWATSPIALLGVPGAWLVYRQGKRRYLWAAVLLVVAFAFGHAVLRREHWFGGLSWPPRFLIPVIPFVLILALPVLDRLTRRPVSRPLVAAVAILLAYSLWVQLSGVSLWWGDYPSALPPESGYLMEWSGGLNQIQYLRWVLIPGLWDERPLEFAWIRTGAALWPLLFAGLALLSGIALWRLSRDNLNRSAASRKWVALPFLFVLLAPFSLRWIAADDLYLGSNASLHALLPALDSVIRPGDVILLDSNLHQPSYERFFLNHSRLNAARVVTLPPQPGERFAPDQTPQAVSDNPDALLTNLTVPLLHALAARHERLWLITDASPFIPWHVRSVERFLNAHYYPIRVLATDVHVIEYSTVDAPDPFAFRGPEHLTDLTYGDVIQLVGYTLPAGTIYAPGDVLPISLYWQARAPMRENYTVAWFLADQNNAVVAQGMDSQPGGGFAPTSQWQVGIPLWDNRALRLPAELPLGQYRLWVKVYAIGGDNQVRDLPVEGDRRLDETIGVLDTIIEVRDSEPPTAYTTKWSSAYTSVTPF